MYVCMYVCCSLVVPYTWTSELNNAPHSTKLHSTEDFTPGNHIMTVCIKLFTHLLGLHGVL